MTHSELKRFGVSMDGHLLNQFDLFIRNKHYQNRSEAVRDLVRSALLDQAWEDDDQEVAGSILLFYDHHHRDLQMELTEIQHAMHEMVLATTHFHLDHENCLELIVVKGTVRDIKTYSNQMIALKGVLFGKFTAAPLKG